MSKATDVRVVAATLYFLPVQTRVPLKFGAETLTSVICARVCLTVEATGGRRARGWGETPLSVPWVWPSTLTYQSRQDVLQDFTKRLSAAWVGFPALGHPMEVGHRFQEERLPEEWRACNESQGSGENMPWLAALVCCSAFDLALHDAYGMLLGQPVYTTYTAEYMNADLSAYLEDAQGSRLPFVDLYPADFFTVPPPTQLRAWHLVGGLDAVEEGESRDKAPGDGHPFVLGDWIRRDGLTCLKIKLRGNDAVWDYNRLVQVARVAVTGGAQWLSADFNCTVTDPAYVNVILDRLRDEHPAYYGMLLYVEQPFPYELETDALDVRSVSARKPLFLDESAHDWRMVRRGRELGWTGVALKTCKTQTGALLSCCWARVHGMSLMVQDLTNPMLAQIPHVSLAAHVGTIMGVETNSMQFYPDASAPEAVVHPGLYQRRGGALDLASVRGPGFGYRIEEIQRALPTPAVIL